MWLWFRPCTERNAVGTLLHKLLIPERSGGVRGVREVAVGHTNFPSHTSSKIAQSGALHRDHQGVHSKLIDNGARLAVAH